MNAAGSPPAQTVWSLAIAPPLTVLTVTVTVLVTPGQGLEYVKVELVIPTAGVNVPAMALNVPPVPAVRVHVPPGKSPAVIKLKRLMAEVELSHTVAEALIPVGGFEIII